MKNELLVSLQKAASTLGVNADSVAAIALDFPENAEHGDFTSNVAMVNAKKLGMKPVELASKIVAEFEKNKPVSVKTVAVAGPGFINFTLTAQAVSEIVRDIQIPNIGNNRKILVEYSSPNIAKPFTVGHLRSTVIGDSIARILSALGYSVIRDNHLGDWGTQFGKLLVAIDRWGADIGGLDGIKKSERPIKALVDLYVKFHDEAEKDPVLEDIARAKFKLLESGTDQKITDAWKTCVDISKKEFTKIYDRLGVAFDPKRGDTEIGESFFVTPDKIQPVRDALAAKGIMKESEGAKVVFFGSEDPKKWKYPPLIVEKSDGTSIYATRDLAADLYRRDTYGKGAMIINEVGAEQNLYFRQLIETEIMLGWFTAQERLHIAHGLYRFKDGKMSTRKGNVIWLEDLLDEAVVRASKINADSADAVAVAAIKFNDLKRDSIQDIVFDWDEMMNMTGDSGPYLQYSCVRARAVIEKAREIGITAKSKGAAAGTRPEIAQLDVLERYLMRFPHVVSFAGSSYKPSIIANYLINLASLFNSFYSQVLIADAKDPSATYKVAVTQVFATIMENGLDLLGIKVPERM
ncbi:MAG: arginine--tRNA ligase [Candidatus Taylorbacteria bacterium]